MYTTRTHPSVLRVARRAKHRHDVRCDCAVTTTTTCAVTVPSPWQHRRPVWTKPYKVGHGNLDHCAKHWSPWLVLSHRLFTGHLLRDHVGDNAHPSTNLSVDNAHASTNLRVLFLSSVLPVSSGTALPSRRPLSMARSLAVADLPAIVTSQHLQASAASR